MRRIGHYAVAEVPSFSTLVAESTPQRRARLTPLIPSIGAASQAYDAIVPNVETLNSIKLNKAQKEALIDGYDGRSVKVKRRLSKMIDSLPSADADLCPYCSLDTNPELDHFLPKASFPEFSLYGRNLVPICTPCNRKKRDAIKEKGTNARLFLHPCAEPSQNARVLEAELRYSSQKFVINYYIDDAGVLSTDERALVERHFARLGLNERFVRRANSFMASFKAGVQGHSVATVRNTLNSKISDAEIGEPPNGWRPALCRALAIQAEDTLRWLTSH
jgi:hypothetical protein